MKQALWCFFSPDRTRGLQEISQGRSTTAHSYCRAGMQIFVWFCRMYALGTCDPIWRKWVTQFDFGGCYSYPVRRRVGKKNKTKHKKRRIQEKKQKGVGGRWAGSEWNAHDQGSSPVLSFAGKVQRKLWYPWGCEWWSTRSLNTSFSILSFSNTSGNMKTLNINSICVHRQLWCVSMYVLVNVFICTEL